MQLFESEQDVPHLLRHRYIADDFDKKRVQEMATLIADPANTQIYLTSKTLDDAMLPLHEKWYKIQYKTEKYDPTLMGSLKNPQVNTSLPLDQPPPNTLFPTEFDILAQESKLSEKPQLLQVWDDTEVWYKKDDKFKRPKGIVSLKVYSNDHSFSSTP